MFKPVIHRCELTEEVVVGKPETLVFYVREPSGREILEGAAKTRKDAPALDNARELFQKYVVHEDGSALTKPEVEEMLDMRFPSLHKVSGIVQEKIGLTELAAKKP